MTTVQRGEYPFSAKPYTPRGYDDNGKRDPSQSPLVINAELLHDTEQKRRNMDSAYYPIKVPENTSYISPGDVVFMHKSAESQAIYKQTNVPGELGLPAVSAQLGGWGNRHNPEEKELLKLTRDVYVLGTCPNPRNTPYDIADGIAVHVGGTVNVFANFEPIAYNDRLYAVPPSKEVAKGLRTMDYGEKINLIVVSEKSLLKPALKEATIHAIAGTAPPAKKHAIALLASDHGTRIKDTLQALVNVVGGQTLQAAHQGNRKGDIEDHIDDLISAIMGFKTTMTDLSLGTAVSSAKEGSLFNAVLHKH